MFCEPDQVVQNTMVIMTAAIQHLSTETARAAEVDSISGILSTGCVDLGCSPDQRGLVVLLIVLVSHFDVLSHV